MESRIKRKKRKTLNSYLINGLRKNYKYRIINSKIIFYPILKYTSSIINLIMLINDNIKEGIYSTNISSKDIFPSPYGYWHCIIYFDPYNPSKLYIFKLSSFTKYPDKSDLIFNHCLYFIKVLAKNIKSNQVILTKIKDNVSKDGMILEEEEFKFLIDNLQGWKYKFINNEYVWEV